MYFAITNTFFKITLKRLLLAKIQAILGKCSAGSKYFILTLVPDSGV